MSALLPTMLLQAGKNLIHNLSEQNQFQQKLERADQLQRFDARLEHQLNPIKARFTEFLQKENIQNTGSLDFASMRLKDALFSDSETQAFFINGGGRDGSFTLNQSGFGFTLEDAYGNVFQIPTGGRLEETVGNFFHMEQVKMQASLHPGFSLDQCIHLAFKQPTATVSL
jgi:hypothetical protein